MFQQNEKNLTISQPPPNSAKTNPPPHHQPPKPPPYLHKPTYHHPNTPLTDRQLKSTNWRRKKTSQSRPTTQNNPQTILATKKLSHHRDPQTIPATHCNLKTQPPTTTHKPAKKPTVVKKNPDLRTNG